MHAFVVYIPLTLTSEGSSTVGCHCWKILFALCISWEGPALCSCKPGSGRPTLPTCAALAPDHVAIQHPSGRLRPDLDLGVPAWVHKELKPRGYIWAWWDVRELEAEEQDASRNPSLSRPGACQCKQHSFLRHSLGWSGFPVWEETGLLRTDRSDWGRVEDEETADSACFFPFSKPAPFIHNPAIALLQRIKVSAKPHPSNT